jgi:hypothetical protein
MTTTTVTNTAVTIIAAGSSVPAGTVTTGTTTNQRQAAAVSLVGKLGGILTMKIANGGTGPTAQCEGRVLIAHNASTPSLPAVGTPLAGADWKTVWRFGGGTAANAITEQSYEFGPGVMQLAVEYTGNTGQAVTTEAFLSEVTDSQTA